jgi:site-specific recombinase XerD
MDLSLQIIIDGFLLERRSRGLTRGTVNYYRDELKRFVDWLGEATIEQLGSDDLRRYFLHLGETRNKGGVHAAFRCVRALFLWYEME